MGSVELTSLVILRLASVSATPDLSVVQTVHVKVKVAGKLLAATVRMRKIVQMASVQLRPTNALNKVLFMILTKRWQGCIHAYPK